ncbi:hypothetical protein HI914_01138 [Erysiphe necator]|nr:hypothetical protein HI914_01138 [Erysiphe necator]
MDCNFISKNLALQEKKSTQSSVYHELIKIYGLLTGRLDDSENFQDYISTAQNSSDSSTCPTSRVSQRTSGKFYFPNSHIEYSLNEGEENIRLPHVQRTSLDVEDGIRMETDIDEGYYEYQSGISEMDATQVQLEALTTDRELYMSQIENRLYGPEKIGKIFRWRRSTDFIYEGKPVVRNKIRMRKKIPLRGVE